VPDRPAGRGGFRHVHHVLPNRGPTKRGPKQARDCRTPARHFLTCGVGPIYAVLRHLELKSSRGAKLHYLACGLWFGGSVCRIAKSEIFDVIYLRDT